MAWDPALSPATTLIAGFEGFSAVPYQDQGGTWTIGYGFTYLPNGSKVTQDTPEMEEATAYAILQGMVNKTLNSVRTCCEDIALSDNETEALTSITYNEGTAAIFGNQTHTPSHLYLYLKTGNAADAAKQFGAWIYAGGKPSNGLRNRRAIEAKLFLTPDQPTFTGDTNDADA